MPTTTPPGPALFSTALETKTFSIPVLLEAIRQGRIRIPYFQREFRWRDEDRRLLFDSLQRGFPLGTLLLAEGAAPRQRVLLGGFIAEAAEVSDALWVVDGQQRLSTLAMALLDDRSGAYRPLMFDLERDEFVLGARKRPAPAHCIPTHVLASSAQLNKWLRDAALPDALSDRADQIASRIRDYQLPAYLVPFDGENDELLRTTFARVNRVKHALRSDEVFQALHATRESGKPIDHVRDELSRAGFGELEGKQIERAAMAVSGKGAGGTLVEVVPAGEVPALMGRVSAALWRTVEFLAQDAEVPHVKWLPYGGALATLARLFDLHPVLHERNRRLLRRWYWRGNLSGDHRTDNRTDGPKWQAIDADEHGSIQRLLRLQARTSISDELTAGLQAYDRSSARTRIELIALSSLEPRVLTGEEKGQLVPLAILIGESKDFPPTVAKAPGKTIASVLLHEKIDRPELTESGTPEDLLSSHGLDGASWAALLTGDDESFIRLRTEVLTAHVRETLARWTELDPADRDRRPLDAYFEEPA